MPMVVMVHADKPDETEMAELFLREAILMKDFHHVHVLGVIGVSFDSDASPMVILPYMANGDLRQYITSAQLVRCYSYQCLKGTCSRHDCSFVSFIRKSAIVFRVFVLLVA